MRRIVEEGITLIRRAKRYIAACELHLQEADRLCCELEEYYSQPKCKRGLATIEEVTKHNLPIYWI